MEDRITSEFGGGGVMPNTVYPKGEEALTAPDKLRLQSITGQETDSQAPVNLGHWYGNDDFDETKPAYTYKEHEQKLQEIAREEANRYKESPRSFD